MLNLFLTPSALAIDPENVTMAWQTTLLGMGMIFSVLALLWGILAIFEKVFASKKNVAPTPARPAVAPTHTQVNVSAAPKNDDAQLVAVITAAISAYMADESGAEVPDGSFRVVSFKRVRSGRAWNSK